MAVRTVNDGYYVDGETGEMIPVAANATIASKEERENCKKKAEAYTKRAELALLQREICGDFYWTIFNSREEYYPTVTDSMLAKIVYLITYMDYGTNILMVRDSATEPKRPMTKKDMQKVIRLHRCKFSRFWDEMLATGIITEEDDGKLRVCKNFCKGKLTNKNAAAMKVFTHAVKYMYENVDVRSHRYIAYLFRLIPYISLRYNIVCKNPLETNESAIEWMTVKEICQVLKIDESQAARFMNNLFSLEFVDRQGDKNSVVMFLKNTKNDEVRNFIIINPQFYSGYMCQDDMRELLDDFKLIGNTKSADGGITAP